MFIWRCYDMKSAQNSYKFACDWATLHYQKGAHKIKRKIIMTQKQMKNKRINCTCACLRGKEWNEYGKMNKGRKNTVSWIVSSSLPSRFPLVIFNVGCLKFGIAQFTIANSSVASLILFFNSFDEWLVFFIALFTQFA